MSAERPPLPQLPQLFALSQAELAAISTDAEAYAACPHALPLPRTQVTYSRGEEADFAIEGLVALMGREPLDSHNQQCLALALKLLRDCKHRNPVF